MTENLKESFSLTAKLIILTLMMQIKTVVTEKHLFGDRGSFFSNNFLEKLDYQDFDAKIKIKTFSIGSYFPRVGLSNEISIYEIKRGVAEKIQFDL